jgi:hypothetical protein
MRSNDNVLGNPADSNNPGAGVILQKGGGGGPCLVTDFTDPMPPAPPGLPNTEWVYASGNYFEGVNGKNYGFYLLGPADSTGAAQQVPGTTLTNTLSKQEMQCTVPAATTPITVMLRRLACPHLPPNDPSIANPPFNAANPRNPYVTVDYVENIVANQQATAIANRHSVGRPEPYMANGVGPSNPQNQQSPTPALAGQPQHTFFMHNQIAGTALAPAPMPLTNVAPPAAYYPTTYQPDPTPGGRNIMAFSWLTHLDRELISPMEVLHVSLYKPHELTQQFRIGGAPFQHITMLTGNSGGNAISPWFDTTLRLYRAFEFFECRGRMSGEANITFTFNGNLAAGQQTIDVTTATNANLLNPRLSVALLAPTGVTPGNGALWGIREGMTLIVDTGVPGVEESVLVLGQNTNPAGPPPTATTFTAIFANNHNGTVNITIPFLGGRQPGKININTITDKEVLRALCDPQACNSFYGPNLPPGQPNDQLVDDFYTNYLIPWVGGPNHAVTPFGPFSLGNDIGGGPPPPQWPNGISINNTLMRLQNPANPPGPNNRPILAVPGQNHPYLETELMTKIFNNVTVRSNAFAVWGTVGFFEVNANGQLGAEIGRVDGRQMRQRFFAIIDRSALDPWVQMMNALLGTFSNADWSVQYDVGAGVSMTPINNPPNLATKPTVGNNAGQIPPELVIPLLGNTALDPRKDYSVIPIPPPSNAKGLPSGPPATVLHWTVIQ